MLVPQELLVYWPLVRLFWKLTSVVVHWHWNLWLKCHPGVLCRRLRLLSQTGQRQWTTSFSGQVCRSSSQHKQTGLFHETTQRRILGNAITYSYCHQYYTFICYLANDSGWWRCGAAGYHFWADLMSVWQRLSPSSRRPPMPEIVSELAPLKSCDILCAIRVGILLLLLLLLF